MSVTFKVKCPVCNESLEYQHEQDEAWGIIPLEDQGCAEVTINDRSGNISAHLTVHRVDGTWLAAFEARLQYQADRAASYFARKQSTGA